MSRFRSSSANNQLLISHIISKIIFINIYNLLGPKWSQNQKCSEFIKIWHMWYFEYSDLDFDFKNYFYQIFTNCQAQIGPKIKNAQNLLKFEKNRNLIKILITIIFDIKIEIGIFKISNVPNFNKFWAFLTLRLIWG